MTSISLVVNGAYAKATVSGPLTGGMTGIPVTIAFDSAWEGLSKTLVCKGGGTEKSIVGIGNTAAVAYEVMQAGSTLYLGIEGRNAEGTLVMPTVWAVCGIIEAGANASDDLSAVPDNPVWAQLQRQIGTLEDLDTDGKENLVQAVNEVFRGGSGSAENVRQAVESYLEENPPKESDPTVPSWAKNPQKPAYTAEEVGAEAAGTASAAVSAHNADAKAHSDIRQQISSIKVPARVSELANDAGYLTEHQDVSGLAEKSALSAHTENSGIHVTAAQKAAWDAKSDFSGSYNDLSDKPSIPAVPDKLSGFINDLYSTAQLEITYEDGSTETVNMVVAV